MGFIPPAHDVSNDVLVEVLWAPAVGRPQVRAYQGGVSKSTTSPAEMTDEELWITSLSVDYWLFIECPGYFDAEQSGHDIGSTTDLFSRLLRSKQTFPSRVSRLNNGHNQTLH